MFVGGNLPVIGLPAATLQAQVELVRLEVVAMEEDDSFGSGIVDVNYSCRLHLSKGTSLIDLRSFSTRLSRWNFCCCEILLYLQNRPLLLLLNSITIYHHTQQLLINSRPAPPSINPQPRLPPPNSPPSPYMLKLNETQQQIKENFSVGQYATHHKNCWFLHKYRFLQSYFSLQIFYLRLKIKLIFEGYWLPCPSQSFPTYINKIISPMPKPLPSHDKFLKQFISAAQIPSKQERGQVREQFKIKLAHHINMLQHHQLRQERVALAQQIAIQNQNDALHRTKHFLQQKQAKAQTNKSHSLLERSKKAEGDLARWERIVDRNREKYERELEQAKIVIKLWNDKLSQSCARKSTHLEGLSRNIKEKMEAKEKRIMTMRLKGELSPLNFNPEYFDVASPKHSSPTRKQTRISTESFLERRRRQEEEHLKQSIIRTVGKEERINQARYMRHYMQERRRKQHLDKEEFIRAMRDNNLTALRNNQEDRSQNIQRKLSRDPIREKHEYESPKRRARGSESVKAVFNAFGMEEREGASLQSSPNRNYDRMMTEKLKDISSIMRKQKRLA